MKGEVYVFLDVDDTGYYEELESVFVAINRDQTLVPFFIEYIDIVDDKALVKFEGVDSAEEAERLVSCELYLPLDRLPQLSEDQYYYHEIIGFLVVDQKEGELDKVNDVYTAGSQDLISMNYKNAEVLIPIQDEIVKKVDKQWKKIFVSLPEGLLDIYLNP